LLLFDMVDEKSWWLLWSENRNELIRLRFVVAVNDGIEDFLLILNIMNE
jgi:hypothetical protein